MDEQCSSNKTVCDERLDFLSAKFDPLLALNTPGLKPPVASAKTHDNIQKWHTVHNLKLPDRQPGSKASAGTSRATPEDSNLPKRRFQEHQMPIPGNRRKTKNVLTRMDKEAIAGPLSILKTVRDENLQIKIWTRHSNGIRGYCIARLVAFDKYWNMALRDVQEVWTRRKKTKVSILGGEPLKGKALEQARKYFPKVTVIKSDKKVETCERHVDELLIRGEHVAIVTVLRD